MAKNKNIDSTPVSKDESLAILFRKLHTTIGQIASVYEGKDLSVEINALKRLASESVQEPVGKKSRAKAKKDENAPPKPKSAYLLFSADKRVEIKKKNPEMHNSDLFKALGEAWKKATPAEKKKYEKICQKNQAQYLKDLEAYKASLQNGNHIVFNSNVATPTHEAEGQEYTQEDIPNTQETEDHNAESEDPTQEDDQEQKKKNKKKKKSKKNKPQQE